MGSGRWKHPALNEIDLGDITDQGQGESRDDATAAKFFRRDAERGDAKAQLSIALMLADGTGVAKDPVAAYMFAELAAYRASGKLRESALKLQEHLAGAMNAAEIERAKEAARLWHPKTG
jgi:TPR repeat protein